jgi:hypothetical protein
MSPLVSLFRSVVWQNVNTARGADAEANVNTFRKKYGPNYEPHLALAKEILEKCNQPKS